MSLDELKTRYGNEYPNAVTIDGIRVPLDQESRFSRSYALKERELGCDVSRFEDGSASMTAAELQREWPNWTEGLRSEFCWKCSPLEEQADFPEMLRFIMQSGSPEQWAGTALSIARQLPSEEAFQFLVKALAKTGPGHCCNVRGGIAITKHPDAETKIREHLASHWADPAMWKSWDEQNFISWKGICVVGCIRELIEFGASPAEFEANVKRLLNHVCSYNREACAQMLSKHYPWLKESGAEV